jgi:hypothetical protein
VSDDIPQGICIFCGTTRPANVAICPMCKRTWIDRRLTDEPGATPGPPPVAADAPGEPEPIDVVSVDEVNARIAEAAATPPEGAPTGAAEEEAEDLAAEEPATEPAAEEEPEEPVEAEELEEPEEPEELEEPEEPEELEEPEEPAGDATADPEAIATISLDELNARIAEGGGAPPPPPPPTVPPATPPPPPPPPAPEDFFAAPQEPAPPEPPIDLTDTTDGAEAPADPAAHDRHPWWVALGVAAAVVALYLIVFVVLLNDGNGEPVVLDSTTTTSTEATTTTTTTEATTTTTSTTTTTTIPPIDAIGGPIPLTDLELGAFALGPLNLTTGSTDALGRLVATLGQPDLRRDAGEADGLCPDTTGVTYTWGGLTAIFFDVEGTQPLVGYRLTPAPEGAAIDTDVLTTLSGLHLGQTVGDIRAIYANSGVAVIDRNGTPTFVLQRSSDARTLLWGPVSSSDDDGIVEGIYSPLWCDDGPTVP